MSTSHSNMPHIAGGPMSLLLVAAIMVAGTLMTFSMGMMGWGVVLVGLVGVSMLTKPVMLMVLFMLWRLVNPIVSAYFIRSSMFQIADEGVLVVMLGFLIATMVVQKNRRLEPRGIVRIVFPLLGLCLLSAIANRVPVLIAVTFATTYLGFLIVFFFTHTFLQGISFKKMFIAILAIFIFEFALNVAWRIGLNPLPNRMLGTMDFARGTFEGCNYIAYFMVAIILMILSWWNQIESAKELISVFVCFVIAVLSLYVTATWHVFLMLPFSVAIHFLFVLKGRRHKARIAAICFGIFILLVPFSMKVASDFEQTFARSTVKDKVERTMQGVKAQAHKDVFVTSRRQVKFPILGAGPGNFASATGRKHHRPLAEYYINYVQMSYRRDVLSHGHSVTGTPETGLLAIWSELGPFGFLLFFGLHAYAMMHVLSCARRDEYEDKYQRILAHAFISVMLFWISINLIGDFLFLDFLQYGLWFWCACVWTPRVLTAQEQEETDPLKPETEEQGLVSV